MKIGETFVDGGYKYKVVGKHELGYDISERVDNDTEVVAETKEEKVYTKTQINRTSSADLEKICEELELEKGTGSEMKKAIIEKLGL